MQWWLTVVAQGLVRGCSKARALRLVRNGGEGLSTEWQTGAGRERSVESEVQVLGGEGCTRAAACAG